MMNEVKLEDPQKITLDEFKVLFGHEAQRGDETATAYPKFLDLSTISFRQDRNRRKSDYGMSVADLNSLTEDPRIIQTFGFGNEFDEL